MATIAELGTRTWTTTAGNKTITATPTFGTLIVAICANSGRTTAQLPTFSDNQAIGGSTWSRYTTVDCTKNTSADSMCVFVRGALIQAASSTVFTMTQSSDTGGGFGLFAITGLARTGSNAIRQGAKQDNQAGGGTPTPVLGSAALTGNCLLGAVFNATNPAGLTPRGTPAWTEVFDVGYNTPASGLEVMRIDSGETGTSIAWGGTSASAFCSLVIEFDCSAEVPPGILVAPPPSPSKWVFR